MLRNPLSYVIPLPGLVLCASGWVNYFLQRRERLREQAGHEEVLKMLAPRPERAARPNGRTAPPASQ
jgi:hypothetical protein